ncbi:MAG TPA: hypothetical protein VI432_02310 [Candidatus Paceibacterota bacterium]
MHKGPLKLEAKEIMTWDKTSVIVGADLQPPENVEICVQPFSTFKQFKAAAKDADLIITSEAGCHWMTSKKRPYWIDGVGILPYDERMPVVVAAMLKSEGLEALTCEEGVALVRAIKSGRISVPQDCTSIDLLACGGVRPGGRVVALRPSSKKGWTKMELFTRIGDGRHGHFFAVKRPLPKGAGE